MEIETIRSEVLRLEAEFSGLYHAIIERTDDDFDVHRDMDVDQDRGQQVVVSRGFSVLSDNFFLSSPRAHIFTLWRGKLDRALATRAEEEFERLADLAAANVSCDKFPLFHEQRNRVRLKAYGTDPNTGIGFDSGDSTGVGLDEWIGHLIVACNVMPETPTVRGCDGGVIAAYRSHLLPVNSFLASADALLNPPSTSMGDPLDVWVYSRWQYEPNKTGQQIFEDYEAIRATNKWPKVESWDALRKRAERHANRFNQPFRKSTRGRPKKNSK
jgi:hypothetical protein